MMYLIRQRATGSVWVLLGLIAVILGNAIRKPGFANTHDPGPRFFPLLLAAILMGGGLVQWLKLQRGTLAPADPIPSEGRALVWFLAGFVFYLFAIPWLGFTLASILFGGVMLWKQGSRWYIAGVGMLCFVLAVQYLFGSLFKVQLPSGVLFG